MSHDEDKLRDALQRLTNGACREAGLAAIHPDRDADLILGAAITELLKLRAARGGAAIPGA